jgi:hypothetical protein
LRSLSFCHLSCYPFSMPSNGYILSFSYFSKAKEKNTLFFHKPWVILGFLFLETIQRHLCLSYIHSNLCVFLLIFFYILSLNLSLLDLLSGSFLRYHTHLIFFFISIIGQSLIWFMILKSFDPLSFLNLGLWKHVFLWNILESIYLKMQWANIPFPLPATILQFKKFNI